ncbi:MAG: tRNA pseudouridine(55) synthase TruB [Bacteroidetes bacterium]|nr:tRNA pseudouridine(55) synthase TruB [Bacteroidota bacterium]
MIHQDSIFLADKPLDKTSFDIVALFKREFQLKKIGHSGTLDPKATGLLILCSGKKTKLINEFIDYDKEYNGIIRIGATTPTFDTESEEENLTETESVTDEMIEKIKEKFTGDIEQIPPMHSAVKHKGKPLYKMARKGETIERKPRQITISELYLKRISDTEIFFNVSCSKGTYIRTLANDIGAELGVGGYLKTLQRTRIGKYKLEEFADETKGVKYKILKD